VQCELPCREHCEALAERQRRFTTRKVHGGQILDKAEEDGTVDDPAEVAHCCKQQLLTLVDWCLLLPFKQSQRSGFRKTKEIADYCDVEIWMSRARSFPVDQPYPMPVPNDVGRMEVAMAQDPPMILFQAAWPFL
jgi:hypothetical protein